jgi:glycine/D-amino acid oxidase-like deaminating enzyme/nitrite reductase/ring-hydroxylating ferredoxin subunit
MHRYRLFWSARSNWKEESRHMGVSHERCDDLPGMAESYWIDTSPDTGFPPLAGDGRVDVTVIGGGIAGISTAFMLKRGGMTVALLDAYQIVKGTSGYTTAKITALHRLIYRHLIDRFGREKARQYADANQASIDTIASLVGEFNIPCAFERKPAYTYAESDESEKIVRDEADAARTLGLPATFVEDVPLPGGSHGAVLVENQAQFHPRNYLLALAGQIPGEGCYIFEMTQALGIRERNDRVTVQTNRGALISDYVVLATHYPLHDTPGAYYARMRPSRSYALGIRIEEPFPDGMFINAQGPVHSWRSHPMGDGDLVIVTGEEHATGRVTDTRAHYRSLEACARGVYTVRSVDYHWSAQDYLTSDRVPYIGRLAEEQERVYVATGFGKWGMTTGTVAATILSDLILGRSNPWTDIFDPSRFQGQPATPKRIPEILESAGGTLVVPASRYDQAVAGLPHCEGMILEVDERRIALYRDVHGDIHGLDPTCMHRGCTVAWNNAEKSWDCPCHGSRYDAHGHVIEGPTVHPLKPLTIRKD